MSKDYGGRDELVFFFLLFRGFDDLLQGANAYVIPAPQVERMNPRIIMLSWNVTRKGAKR